MTTHEQNGATPMGAAEPTESQPQTQAAPMHQEHTPASAPPPAAYPVALHQQPDGHQQHGYQQAPGHQPGMHGAPGQMTVAPKSPALMALASFFVDGLGQALNGNVAKGAIIFVCMVFGWTITYLTMGILIGFLFWPVMACLHLWQVYDAYKGAQKWNLQHGIIS